MISLERSYKQESGGCGRDAASIFNIGSAILRSAIGAWEGEVAHSGRRDSVSVCVCVCVCVCVNAPDLVLEISTTPPISASRWHKHTNIITHTCSVSEDLHNESITFTSTLVWEHWHEPLCVCVCVCVWDVESAVQMCSCIYRMYVFQCAGVWVAAVKVCTSNYVSELCVRAWISVTPKQAKSPSSRLINISVSSLIKYWYDG